mgnify:FL=1
MSTLEQVIAEYRAQHGEPAFRYYKKYVVWSKFRRKPGYHVTPIGDGDEVTREEYEANIAESKRQRGEAFMGRLPHSYWEYGQKMIRDGWREALIKDVQSATIA